MTSATSGAHIFCPQTTQELPKKHSETGPPEQLPTDALSQIDDEHTRHCEDCLCQTNNAKSIFKCLSRDMRMAERKMPLPPPATCQNAPPPLKIWGMIVYYTTIALGECLFSDDRNHFVKQLFKKGVNLTLEEIFSNL